MVLIIFEFFFKKQKILFIYRVHEPQLRGYSILPCRTNPQTLYSVNWLKNEGIEIVNGKTGRTVCNKLSRICKRELAKDFIKLCISTNTQSIYINNQINTFYDSLKKKNENYINANQSLVVAFKLSNFGTWVTKPEELKTFKINTLGN